MPSNVYLEILLPGHPCKCVPVSELPFLIGRGRENGNDLSLDDLRISRSSARISADGLNVLIEDRGQRGGIFVNGQQTASQTVCAGDRIRFGTDDECQVVYRVSPEGSIRDEPQSMLLNILGAFGKDSSDELDGLRLLLDATSLMASQLPLESVLATMIDHAIVITKADRGMLLQPDGEGVLQVKIARGGRSESLEPAAMNPSRSVLGRAIELQTAVVHEDLNIADLALQGAQSVLVQGLQSSVVIPLYGTAPIDKQGSREPNSRPLLGALYLDSTRVALFSTLNRAILDALGAQAQSILEKAQLIEQERDRQRLEQELSIAREIQQALVPQGLQDYPHYSITGKHRPCFEVGGDYFDVCRVSDGRIGVLIADVAGKGLGAALLTTMLQGALSAMTLGVNPVLVFEHLNEFLYKRSAVGRSATMFFGLLAADGILEFVRAGHPAPLLLRRGEVSELYSTGTFPVGLVPGATFSSTRIQLELGDTLLLYTDGLTETESRTRELFQDGRLKEAFGKYQDAPINEIQDGIFASMDRFANGASQADDVTLLVVRYRARG